MNRPMLACHKSVEDIIRPRCEDFQFWNRKTVTRQKGKVDIENRYIYTKIMKAEWIDLWCIIGLRIIYDACRSQTLKTKLSRISNFKSTRPYQVKKKMQDWIENWYVHEKWWVPKYFDCGSELCYKYLTWELLLVIIGSLDWSKRYLSTRQEKKHQNLKTKLESKGKKQIRIQTQMDLCALYAKKFLFEFLNDHRNLVLQENKESEDKRVNESNQHSPKWTFRPHEKQLGLKKMYRNMYLQW